MDPLKLKCTTHPEWFDGVDIEDSRGNLIGYNYPFEKQAKAECASCPALDWCKNTYQSQSLEGVIIYGTTDTERRRTRRSRKVRVA